MTPESLIESYIRNEMADKSNSIDDAIWSLSHIVADDIAEFWIDKFPAPWEEMPDHEYDICKTAVKLAKERVKAYRKELIALNMKFWGRKAL